MVLLLGVIAAGIWKGPQGWASYQKSVVERQLKRDRALFDAAVQSDMAGVKSALADGANPNYAQSPNKLTPLMQAGIHNNPEIIRELIKSGADPNAVSRDGNNTTALMYGVAGDATLESVKALVEGGAQVDARHGNWGYSALMRAVRYTGRRSLAISSSTALTSTSKRRTVRPRCDGQRRMETRI
jgi:ankyrin repeat protein